jgi:formylglycine-generating enzyme required for sulfatase activity
VQLSFGKIDTQLPRLEQAQGMSDIFIGYSRSDFTIAKQLTERLEAEDWTVYLDVQTPVGTRWHKEIEQQLHAAKAVVALWSARSRDSDFVLEEADYGRRQRILFPAFIEAVEFPYGFSRIQTADMIGWTGEPGHPGLVQLLAALKGHLGVGTPSPNDNAVELSPSPHGGRPGWGRAKGDEASDLTRPHPNPPPLGEGIKVLDSTAFPTLTPPANPFVPGQTFRDTLKIGGEGPLMMVIPPGKFIMGSPPAEPQRFDREGPQHEVMIKTPFALGVCAVTFADYDLFCRDTQRDLPNDRGWGRDNRPVINVSWQDAQAYCTWLSKQTGYGYRLPSEAEWEYACRAGTQTPFSFGGNITPEQVNYDGNYPYAGGKKGWFREQTVPVRSLPPNAWGLYEMHGNVWEWVQDAWHDNYKDAPTDGSAWESGYAGGPKVVRGGSWNLYARLCRSAFRRNDQPNLQLSGIGFRCARV